MCVCNWSVRAHPFSLVNGTHTNILHRFAVILKHTHTRTTLRNNIQFVCVGHSSSICIVCASTHFVRWYQIMFNVLLLLRIVLEKCSHCVYCGMFCVHPKYFGNQCRLPVDSLVKIETEMHSRQWFKSFSLFKLTLKVNSWLKF